MPDNSDEPGASIPMADLLTLATSAGNTLDTLLSRMRAMPHQCDMTLLDAVRQGLKQVRIDLAAMQAAHDESMRIRDMRLGVMKAQGASDLQVVRESEPDGLE